MGATANEREGRGREENAALTIGRPWMGSEAFKGDPAQICNRPGGGQTARLNFM